MAAAETSVEWISTVGSPHSYCPELDWMTMIQWDEEKEEYVPHTVCVGTGANIEFENLTYIFSDGMAVVMRDEKYGFIDQTGEIAIPLDYDGAENFSEGLARVWRNGKCGMIDMEGNVVIPLEYENMGDIHEDMAWVFKEGKCGFVDLQIVPIWFSTGIVLSVLMPLCVGITVVIEPVFSKENFAADLIKYRPNITLGATSLWLYTMKSRKLKYKDLSFLKYPITGGEQMLGRVETAVNAFLKKHGCRSPLIKGYGMCELGSTISTDDREHQKQDAAGFPITGVVVAAFDTETNQELPYNKHGELRVISPAHMKEYFKNPAATAEFFWADMEGRIWGRTGDIGYVDEDGFVHVLGRASDQFTAASGRKHYCFDIENVILQEPNVAQCEVVGLSQSSGEIPVAHLILEEDTKVDTMELLKKIHELCAHTLDEECVPYGYRICGEFPVKNTGKRDMGKLKTIREGFFVPSAGWVTNI